MRVDASVAVGWRALDHVPGSARGEAEEGCFYWFETAASPVSARLSLPCWPQVGLL